MHSLGKYVNLELVGQGASAKVYKAYHPELGVYRALKVFSASDQSREERIKEAVSQAGLDHPGIVRVLDCGRENGIFYLVMEYASGGTLRQRLAQGPFPQPRALDLAGQVADALTSAHARGILHLDLKPENLLFFSPDRVKIGDFGLARSFDEQNPITVAAGTPNYMAPEQLNGHPQAASDLWSLGCLLYEMLTGQVCFAGESLREIQAAVKRGPGDISHRLREAGVEARPGLADLLQSLMHPLPLQRTASADEALGRITGLQKGNEASITPKSVDIPTQIISNHCIGCGEQIPLGSEYCPNCTPQTQPRPGDPNAENHEPKSPLKNKPSLVRPGAGLSRVAAPLLGLLLAAGAAYGWWAWNQKETGLPAPIPQISGEAGGRYESDTEILLPALVQSSGTQKKKSGEAAPRISSKDLASPSPAPSPDSKAKPIAAPVPPPPAVQAMPKPQPQPAKPLSPPKPPLSGLASKAKSQPPAPPARPRAVLKTGPASRPASQSAKLNAPTRKSGAAAAKPSPKLHQAKPLKRTAPIKVRSVKPKPKPSTATRYAARRVKPRPASKPQQRVQARAAAKPATAPRKLNTDERNKKVLTSLRSHIRNNPNQLGSQRNLTLSYMQQGNYQAALKQARAILKNNPQDLEAKNTIALIRVLAARQARKP